ncbi:hypothetical protein ABFS83_03G083300 [Erythranthe nasuta]
MGDSSRQSRTRNHQKVAVFNEVMCRLRELNVEEAAESGFEDELWAHFSMLPLRYASDIDAEQAKDVLMHKKLLDKARDPLFLTGPAVHIRLVKICMQPHNLGNYAQPSFGEGGNDKLLHEITIATKDKPKLLSAIGCLMSEIGLVIQECHAFSTIDGYSFVTFLVDGWEKGIDHLRSTLVKEISDMLATKENTKVNV